MESFVNFVIRPPRADYSIDDLLNAEFSIRDRKIQRKDLEIENAKGQVLQCSHYIPLGLSEDAQLPCVIYCHGNSGCRADGNEAAIVLLSSNITVFTFDFSGSGLSDGDYVSLGWNEKDDLRAAVSYLRSLKQVSCIGLWGRSMGAVTSLMYGADDPSIAGIVLDSPFSNLFELMMELVDVYKIRLPKFTVRMALQIMRKIIQRRAKFDLMDLNISQAASKVFIPALFGHATEDVFIHPRHSDLIYQKYAGDKNIIKFEGDHNSSRPQFYYDSVTIFFQNVLVPPVLQSADNAWDALSYGFDTLQIYHGLIENTNHDVSSEQSIPIRQSEGHEDQVVAPDTGVKVCLPLPVTVCNNDETNVPTNNAQGPLEVIELFRRVKCGEDTSELSCLSQLFETKGREQFGDNYSYPSSNGASTESWGRCSSHGISENSVGESPSGQNFANVPTNLNDEEQMIVTAIAASLKDNESNETRKNTQVQKCRLETSRPRKCKFEAFGRRFKISCFKGMGKRGKA